MSVTTTQVISNFPLFLAVYAAPLLYSRHRVYRYFQHLKKKKMVNLR